MEYFFSIFLLKDKKYTISVERPFYVLPVTVGFVNLVNKSIPRIITVTPLSIP